MTFDEHRREHSSMVTFRRGVAAMADAWHHRAFLPA